MKIGFGSKTENEKSTSHLRLFIFLKLSDTPYIVSMRVSKNKMKPEYNASEESRKSESYQQDRLKYIQQYSDQIAVSLLENPDVKDLSAHEKEEWVKKCHEELGKLYDMSQDMLYENIIDY